jgi:hypothetical protein
MGGIWIVRGINDDNYEFLQKCALNVLEKCKVNKRIKANGKEIEFSLHVPGGDMKYGSFWVRDAIMMAESGLIPTEEIKGWLILIASSGQNGPKAVDLENNLVIPPWAVADHINFDGHGVFFPGTYDSGPNQGNGTYGIYPPHDDAYYFIEAASLYCSASKDMSFLSEKIEGVPLIEHMERAFESYNIDELTQLCVSEYPGHTVDWGFCDGIIKSGCLLFPSLLRYRAACRLKEIFSLNDPVKSEKYSRICTLLKENIVKTFYDESGWFLSSTGLCCQKDVWGTAFAVWLDIQDEPLKQKSAAVLLKSYKNNTAVSNGYVRQIVEGDDASKNSAWEKTISEMAYNTYQNGGYWATPTGWYVYALSLVDKSAAFEMIEQFIEHTVNFTAKGAPLEWRSTDDKEYSGLFYGTSAVLTYAGYKRITDHINI